MPPTDVAVPLLAVDESEDRDVEGVRERCSDASSDACSVGYRIKYEVCGRWSRPTDWLVVLSEKL